MRSSFSVNLSVMLFTVVCSLLYLQFKEINTLDVYDQATIIFLRNSGFISNPCPPSSSCNLATMPTKLRKDVSREVIYTKSFLSTQRKNNCQSLMKCKTDGNTIWSKCCEIGASPATFASRAEFECLTKRYWEMPDGFKESSGYHPYYIGARDMNLTRNFQFCPDHRLIPDELWIGHIDFENNPLEFAGRIEPNNRDGMERCVCGVMIPRYVGLVDVNCISTNKYICQETESAAGNELQIVSSELGILQTECKTTKYLISNASGTMVDAWKICCGFSMIPAVIESRTEMKCIQDRFQNHTNETANDLFRVSHMDFSLSRKFTTCQNSTLNLTSDMWAPTEPDNYKNQEACTAFQ
ncbi:hypothetical protein B566_EDAN016725, partial [Ephemera danica]